MLLLSSKLWVLGLASVAWLAVGCAGSDFGATSGKKASSSSNGDEEDGDDSSVDQDAAGPDGGEETESDAAGDADEGDDDGKLEEDGESCSKRKLLIYAMQPAGSSAVYETQFKNLADVMKGKGFNASFSNRAAQPALTSEFLEDYDIVLFGSGCGGATGLPSAAELTALGDFYLDGKSLVVVTDDDIGDSSAPGACFARVNPIAEKLGVSYSGLQDNQAHGCAELDAKSSLLDGLKLGRYTSANITLTGNVAWGKDQPVMIGKLKNGNSAEAYVAAKHGHGAALFSSDFGSMGCEGDKYLARVIERLGCSE